MWCYFHLLSWEAVIRDDTGVVVRDIAEAKVEAMNAIRELREEDGEPGETWDGWHLEATDRSGRVLFSVPVNHGMAH